MTKRTKRALVSSALALLLCFTMLLGTTYAWFTDSVTTVNNKIVAGNLDIELYSAMQPDANADLAWTMVDANTNIFETGTLWEPGHVEVAYLWAKNVGTLALKWDLAINIVDEVTSTSVLGNDLVLSSYLKAQLVEIDATAPEAYADRDAAKAAVTAGYGLTSYTGNGVLKAGETKAYALIVYMPEEVGNEANYAKGAAVPSIDMGITLLATQTPYENDSFGDDYDEDATYPVLVSNAAELANAIANGGEITLADDVTVTSTMQIAANKEVVLDLNGNDLSYAVSNTGASAIIDNRGSLNIVGEGTIAFVADNPDLNAIPTYATNTITNEGSLTIGKGVVVTNGSQGGASYAVDNKGTFVLDGGTLIGDRCALRIAKYNQDNVKFVMNSGLVKAATPAWIQLPGSNSAVAPTISVEINGGTFETTKTPSADNDVLYTYSFGNSHANTSIVINGGNFVGGTVSIGSGYKGDVPALTINGGNFDYDVIQWLENDGSNVLYAAN